MGRSGASFSLIRPKKCWSSGGPSSLQMTLCKGTVICNNPCSSIPFDFGHLWNSPLCKSHLQMNGGSRIIQIIICNNPCSSVPLILVIQRTILFANDNLQRNRGARRRPDHLDDHLQQSLLLCPLNFSHLVDRPLCK